MNLFQRYLSAVMQQRGLNQPELARHLGVTQSTVSRWLSGASPKMETLEFVVQSLGGHIELVTGSEGKAAEPASMPRKGHSGTLPRIRGEFSSRSSRIERTFEADGGMADLTFEKRFEDSPYWALTQGELIFIRVAGAEMAPEMEEGDLLVCRRPESPSLLNKPHSCPVFVVRGAGDEKPVLKLLQVESGLNGRKVVMGLPLVRTQSIQIFDPERCSVSMVCVGVLRVSLL